jgi:hypothetical protein
MRNYKTRSRLRAWMLAPLLAVACDRSGYIGEDWYPGFYSIPTCSDPNEVLSTNQVAQLICKPLPLGAAALPDCKKYSQALTSDGSKLFCTHRNNEAQSTRDALDNLEQSEILIKEFQTKIRSLGGPTGPAPRAVYCGQYSAAQNQNGAITDSATGATGIAGAASLCHKVAGCSATAAKMCTVYDLYHSAATSKLPATIAQSWVFMASWQHDNPGQVPAANGLADNCSSYTYPTNDKLWYGTTGEWKLGPAGQKALHFASGPGVVPCSARYPIACCN